MKWIRKFAHVVFVFIILNVIIVKTSAAEESQVHSARKGFVVGFDAGGGGVRFDHTDLGAFLWSFIIGGGLNERILLLAESRGAAGFRDDAPTGYSLLFSPQFFVMESFFVRPGIGIGYGQIENSNGDLSQTDLGVATGLAAGYEWRLTKKFALSPEARADYLRAEGSSFCDYGLVVDLRWYF